MNYYQQFDELYKYFSVELGWDSYDGNLSAGNLLIYFRRSYNEWRIRDMSKFTTMDLTKINFPIDDEEKSRLWGICSYAFSNETKKL